MPNTAKLLAISLADQANDAGICWPSVGSMEERTNLSERTIRRDIAFLEQTGFMACKRRNGSSTVYQLTPATYAPLHDMHPSPARDAPTPAPHAPIPAQGAPIIIKNHQEPPFNQPLTRPPDELWLSLMEACGIDDRKRTKSESGAWNKALRELKDAGATPRVIQGRARAFRKKWPDATLTPTALARRWNECIADNGGANEV